MNKPSDEYGSAPIIGDDRLIIKIKKFYANTTIPTETIPEEEIEYKYVPFDKIPEDIKSYSATMPQITITDPLVQEYSKYKAVTVMKGDAFVFRRLYESAKPIYWRVVK